jgi:peptidyl-prolyl cis-trans isomerase SurA
LKIVRPAALTLALLGLFAVPAAAQRQDGIAAIVNDDVVLESDVEEQLFLLVQSLGQNASPDSSQLDTLRHQILERMIEDKLVIGEAKRQGITIADGELDKQTEAAIADVKRRLGGDQQFADQLRRENTTIAQVRTKLREQVRSRLLGARLIEKQFPRRPVPQSEAEAFFKTNPTKFPKVPAEVKLAVIQVPVTSDSVDDAKGRTAILAARKRILGGEKFAKVAQEVSEDPGSKNSGGDLGFFTEGTMEPGLENIAFRQPLHTLSEPLRTPYGWHLAETLDRDTVRTAAGRDSVGPDGKPVLEAHVRHILIRVPIDEDDALRAKSLAERVRGEAVKGTNFGTLVRRYSKYEGPTDEEGVLGFISVATLQDHIRAGIDSLEISQVSEVLPNQLGFNIFKLLDRKPPRDYNLEEVRDRLPAVVGEMRAQEKYEAWVKTIRTKSNIQIR